MAHYPKIFDFTGGGSITNITFNNFFNAMGQFGGTLPLEEGWYRITDHRTTGYVLDRQWMGVIGGTEYRTYGCTNAIDNITGNYTDVINIDGNNSVENDPILVWVTLHAKSGFNRHQHRVYSELYPQDEIYWTWDWGIDWSSIRKVLVGNGIPYNYPGYPSWREWNFQFDATLFTPDSNGYNQPLQTIENPDFYETVAKFYKAFDWQHWKGYTYRRKDTAKNIEGSYDWRNVYLARYSSQDVYKGWNPEIGFAQGDVVYGNDNWIYVSLIDKNIGVDPTLYDSMNAPLAYEPVTFNSLFVGSYTGMEPTSPYAPLSSRRAWLRLWPKSYKWYSPWVNGGKVLGKYYFLGDLQVDPNYRVAQPFFFPLECDPTPYYVKTFSGDGDNLSDQTFISNTSYINNVNLGTKSFVPNGPEFRHLLAGKKFIPKPYQKLRAPLISTTWRTTFDSKYGADTVYTPDTIHPTENYPMMSYVNDNRIVTFPVDPKKIAEGFGVLHPDNTYEGNTRGGIIDGIKFGSNSAGNTFYIIPWNQANRQMYWNNMDANWWGPQDRSRKNYDYSKGWQLPDDRQQFGGIDPDAGSSTLINIVNTSSIQLSDRVMPFDLTFNEIDMIELSSFGNNDLGDNFIGNVSFTSFVHTTDDGQYPYDYPRVDDYRLTENIDGVFVGNKFKNNNRYNLFLHGMRNNTIDTSEASLIETASDLNIKSSMYDFLRNVYTLNMDDSRYNSIWSAINIKSNGSIMHNYLDSIYSSTMDDGFWYNDISMFMPNPEDALSVVPWPFEKEETPITHQLYQDGLYFPSGFNTFGPGFAGNSIRGWAISNTFRSNYYLNFKAVTEYSPHKWALCPTYLINNMFGESIRESYIWKSNTTEFESRSFHNIQINPALSQLLWSNFNKKIRLPGIFNPIMGWELSDQPILSFGDNYGVEQFQLWQDSGTIVPMVPGWGPTPYPDF